MERKSEGVCAERRARARAKPRRIFVSACVGVDKQVHVLSWVLACRLHSNPRAYKQEARGQIFLAESHQKCYARDCKEWRRLEDELARLRLELGAATATTMTQPSATPVASSSKQDGKTSKEPDVSQGVVLAQDDQLGRQTRSKTVRSRSKEHGHDENQEVSCGTRSRGTGSSEAKKSRSDKA